MPSQVHLPAWTAVRNASVFASLSVHASPSHSKKKSCIHVIFLPREDESTQSEDDDGVGDSLIAWTFPNTLSQPTKDLILRAVNKAHLLRTNILVLQCLLSDLRSRNAALSEHTYRRKWRNPWPSKVQDAYDTYKKDDHLWRDLRNRFEKHCSTYRNVRPVSRLLIERLCITLDLGDAAVRTSRGRLQFLDKYLCAFAKYRQVGTHIHEGSKALRSAEHAMTEMTLMLNLLSVP
ncbi:hypothetical protein BBK36DRAFT_1168317 [Trichoderma citrinoviride]|uniref:Uncharacterized protein n=1 Tax=Trichoderma citrinoviride TaxID=58853 RepID=A0A2T4BC28_9HYPO|nr:hypothetical protein BBK36DRAFT_1168317 [Trichoderma citrinoviride]PTB66791.1 hypothetical protein BBK36DRAFT_1168317 [Trichoderma citrinoviride]